MPMRSIREIPTGTREFILRVIVVPFEIAIALTAVWAGAAGLLTLSPSAAAFNATLPQWLVTMFNLIYVIAGLAMLTGVGWNYKNAEASGLILLITSLLIRAVALYVTRGFDQVTTNVIVQATLFGGAAVIRLGMILAKRQTVIVATPSQAVVIESVEELKRGV